MLLDQPLTIVECLPILQQTDENKPEIRAESTYMLTIHIQVEIRLGFYKMQGKPEPVTTTIRYG
jgi:hypothetical protein